MKTKATVEPPFEVFGKNKKALFSLKMHRGEGMALLGMNWKNGLPPDDFAGFAIEYKEPGGTRFFPLMNRIAFPGPDGAVNANSLSSRLSPFQKFRWVHFPWRADIKGDYIYRVTPVFMNEQNVLSYGEYQEAAIQLYRETYPDRLNVTFTRGFVSSQAFVDRYETGGNKVSDLLPTKASEGLDFVSTHPKAKEALEWMGFEARLDIIDLLSRAVKDKKAKVSVIAYDLNLPDMVDLLEQLGNRLKIIIDKDGPHGKKGSAENEAERRLIISAGPENVRRQVMGKLQHNKTIIVNSPEIKTVVCGSTNYSWRGFFVQANNAVIIHGKEAVKIFTEAFNNYWINDNNPKVFGSSGSAVWKSLKLNGITAKVTFSPHIAENAVLEAIAKDIETTSSNLFYSLAFLSITEGFVRKAITKITTDDRFFVYGISDKKTGGFDLLKPDGNIAPVSAVALSENVPEPFKSEPSGGGGTRMHHKFVVVDFDKPTARVYLGSYNFSTAADLSNGENLLCIQDRKIATAYMIEALRIFDHYHYRVVRAAANKKGDKLTLKFPPRKPNDHPWWFDDYNEARKIKDRELFSATN